MDAPAPRLSDVHVVPDILRVIYDLLPCPFDCLHMGQVCNYWRMVIKAENQPPRPLPLIFIPQAGGPSLSCVSRGCATHRFQFRVEEEDARAARCFGSVDGGWVFLTIGRHRHRLGGSFKLPSLFVLNNGLHIPLVILAATLSSSQVQGQSVIGAIVSSRRGVSGTDRQLAFWRLGQCDTIDKMMTPEGPGLEDLIFHKGSFHVLAEAEYMFVYTPRCDEGEDIGEIHVQREFRHFSHEGRHYGERVVARYLVESRDELLMVVRLTPRRGQPTSAFRVFQMAESSSDMPDHIFHYTPKYAWNELPNLDGRMLFVGRGCSRSHQVADHAGFEEGVYFLDDGSFRDWHKDELLFQNPDQLQFSCTDSGRWSGPTRQIESFFPEEAPSNHSPPVWILP
ncbi:uncharacterized protein LOC102712729 [Oryza brachyantha]|uniref:uncharacterized protein LOC102712729 n=1 Tax=Oryza brachyantha TaxID=4533 RepID=UPI001ADBFCCC|nr:uncharacterized protein LOC102712729 [Oryza brachyantha]